MVQPDLAKQTVEPHDAANDSDVFAKLKAKTNFGWITITVNVDGAEVSIDGESMGTTPLKKPIKLTAGKLGVDVTDSVISAHVGIGQVDGGFKLEVTLDAKLPNASLEDAKKAVEAAHQVCPYSNATRGNIEVTLNVIE